MFYNFHNDNIPKGLFKSCIVPRPIAWISSISDKGITNLAPFSYFQAICDIPPMIMFVASLKSNGDEKDTVKNIEKTKEFVINLVAEDSKIEMSQSSNELDYGDSEIEKYKIETKKSQIVSPPSILASPINIECKYEKTFHIESNKMIIGKVVGIEVNDKFIIDDRIQTSHMSLLARLGFNQYSKVEKVITIDRMGDTRQKS